MNCGFVLGDKWRKYQFILNQIRVAEKVSNEPKYIDGSDLSDKPTPEYRAAEACGVTRYCCRKVLLTHRDLITQI
jgi:DNA-directed RNA polymerase subunit N (RpoN/RPB10)